MAHRVSNQTLSQSARSGKMRLAPPLSRGAYFPVSTNEAKRSEIISKAPRCMRSWVAIRLSNRVKRGNAAEKQYRVDIHADMMKITRPRPLTGLPQEKHRGGGKRGEITGFSRASRKRLFQFMASVRNHGFMMFLTLTYDDVAWLIKSEAHQDDFEAFRKRFERQFPKWSAIWRVEVQQRKSGMLKTLHVPHLHLIIFTNQEVEQNEQDTFTEVFRQWGSKAWQEITNSKCDDHLIYGFDVSAVKSRKHAYFYVSKYVGKEDTDGIAIGRRWGRIGKFDTSISETFRLDDRELIELKRLIKRWIRNRNKKFAKRFAKTSVLNGFFVLGLGDTSAQGERYSLFAGGAAFLYAAKDTVAMARDRERGWGD